MTIKSVVVFVLRTVVTVALLALILHLVGAERLLERLTEANPAFLTVAVAVSVVHVLALVWRWQVVTRLLSGATVAFSHLTLGMGRSMLLAQPLPSTVGGDVVRVVLLAPRLGLATAARSVICDRVLGLVALVVLVAVVLPFFAYRIDHGVAFLAAAATCAAGLAVTGALVVSPPMLAKVPLIGRYTATVGIDLRTVLSNGSNGTLCIALAVSGHLLSVLTLYLLAQAVRAPLAPLACLFIVPPALLISAIPISLGGWGLREGALAAGFSLAGGNVDGVVVASVMFGLLSPIVGAAIELVVPLVLRLSDIRRRRA
jgi:uncharacterized membrane protein YbhN (UPF0104 family)